jgi:pyruvate, orthophosphate dikinase
MRTPITFLFDAEHNLSDPERLALLGGKGKSLSDMTTQMQLPVPPGFTLVTSACREYLASGWSSRFDEAIETQLRIVESKLGRSFGDAFNPLLLSVRSGGAASMPGMMDTVLNVGLNSESLSGFATSNAGDRGFAKNCFARLGESFRKSVGTEVPHDPREQLRQAIEAVFRSWNSDRAIDYRRIENIADDAGTAVNIQAMVFGNRDDQSGTGVVFSRNPSTGEKRMFGDILFCAQGEDVVAGSHQTLDIAELPSRLPAVALELDAAMVRIERHYRDLVDVEFTIESGRLWILQSRPGKRAPGAAVRIAHDMALDPDFPLTRQEALTRIEPILHLARLDGQRSNTLPVLGRGIAASPGIGSGVLVTDIEEAARLASSGQRVILARPETSPQDIAGIAAAAGLLTSNGGLASHAAVVARGWGKPAVVGWSVMTFFDDGIHVDGHAYRCGTVVSIDGRSGEVFLGALEGVSELLPEAIEMQGWNAVPEPPQIIGTSRVADDDELILLIALKGFCTRNAALEICGLDSAALAARLLALEPDIDAASPRFLKVTDKGKERAAAITAAHRNALTHETAKATLTSFHLLNDQFKTLVTDWQMRPSDGEPVFNDHSDAAYDTAILQQADVLHDRTRLWIDSVKPAGPLPFFQARFDHAILRLRAGETAYLASPKIDSYHNVWFELHEYLIRLAGLTRAEAEGH